MAKNDKEKKELTPEEFERLDKLYKSLKFGSLGSLGITSLVAGARKLHNSQNKDTISEEVMKQRGLNPDSEEGLDPETNKKLNAIIYGGIPLSALTAGYSFYKHYKLKKDYKEQQEEKKRKEEEAKEEKKQKRNNNKK